MSIDLPLTFNSLECRRLGPEWQSALTEFFHTIRQAGADNYFHPHPLTPEESERRCHYTGRDFYYVLVASDKIVGYGMLRGWDEGYETPSLGIAIHPKAQGMGLGTALMGFLHVVARLRGSPRVRLTVYRSNEKGLLLFKKQGYMFQASSQPERLVGVLEL
jgi:ribosomal protein S18 acetylase RimI-like enzyme